MNRIAVMTTSLMMLAGAARATETPPGAKKALEQHLAYFKDEGYKAELMKEGYVKVRVEGKDYYVTVFSTDPRLFFISATYMIASDAKRDALLRAANAANFALSMPKVALTDTKIEYSVVTFLAKSEDLKEAFPKVLSNLQQIQAKFGETYAAEVSRAAAEQKKLAEEKKSEPAKKPESAAKGTAVADAKR